MKQRVAVLCSIMLAACAGNSRVDDSANSGQLLTFQCDGGYADCQRDAIDACGARGFVEVDRYAPAGVTTAGRFIDQKNSLSQGSGRYTESVHAPSNGSSLTVRCN